MGPRCARSALALVAVWVVGLVLGWPVPAAAAPEINVPKAEDGPGIKVGQRSVFHTGAALLVGIDSNVFSTNANESRGDEQGPALSSMGMVTGWLGVGNRSVRDGMLMSPPERTARKADYYFGLVLGERLYFSRRPAVRSQNRPTIGAQSRLALLPGRRFSANFDGDVFYYSQPANYEAVGYNYNRLVPRVNLMFTGRPGGGRFSFSAGPRFTALRFDLAAVDEDIAKANRVSPGFGTELKWRFLPKSALVFNYTMDWTYYTLCCVDADNGRNEDNFAHRITAGYRGQIFKKVVIGASGGWGLGNYWQDPNGPNFSSFIGDLGVSYFPSPRATIDLGVYRSFQDSLLGNYFVDAGARARFRYEFKWRMIASLSTWVAARRYAGLPVPGVETQDVVGYAGRGAEQFQRRDTLFSLLGKVEQPLGRLFAVGLQYDLAVDNAGNFATTFLVETDDGVQETTELAGFTRHVVMLFGAVRI